MRKIPCIFKRETSPDGKYLATPEVTPGCEWVLEGIGQAMIKWDGTSVLLKTDQSGRQRVYQRFHLKRAEQRRDLPEGSLIADIDKRIYWIPATNKWILEAYENSNKGKITKYNSSVCITRINLKDGTYEACGPKINGNRQLDNIHLLKPHDIKFLGLNTIDFKHLKEKLQYIVGFANDFNGLTFHYEGLVFHHPDGVRMAKIRRKDFGFE